MVKTDPVLPKSGTVATASRSARTTSGVFLAARYDSELTNPIRCLAFYAAVALIFLRYSLLHEVLANYLGASSYILYLFAVPALLGVVGSGGIQRTISTTPAKYWIAFVIWFLLAVPLSTWRGESAQYALTYLRTDLPMLFVMAGLALTWKECRTILTSIAIAGICNLAAGLFIRKSFGERAGLEFGLVSNPNDYAGHLLFILPVILFVVLFPPSGIPSPIRLGIRLAGITGIIAGLLIILMTGSRGAVAALAIGVAYVLWKSSMPVRVAALIGIPVLFLVLFAALPNSVRGRLQSITLREGDRTLRGKSDEAEESSRLRKVLLDESVRLTLEHPLFGVGPNQFGNFEGRVALWRSTHNSFTQISSECGIPALLFLLGGMISGFLLIQRTWKRAKLRPQFAEIAGACYCLSLSYLVFCTAIFFLNFAYFFYLPAATGLFIAISGCARREFALSENHGNKVRVASIPSRMAPPRANAVVLAPSKPQAVFRFNRYR